MGRQQTLSKFYINCTASIDRNCRSGKFFDMPRGVKPAPLQQSSLKESWHANPKHDASEEKLETSSGSPAPENAIDEPGARYFS